MIVTNDGCPWQYQAGIVYTSGKSHTPTETSTSSNSLVTLMTHTSYEAQVWNDREYVAGQSGETSPTRTQDRNDFRQEGGSSSAAPPVLSSHHHGGTGRELSP
jgi:hypothetical protein